MRPAPLAAALLLAGCGPRILDPRPGAAAPLAAARVATVDARVRAPLLPPGLSLDDQRDRRGRLIRNLVIEPPWEKVADLQLETSFGPGGLFGDEEIARALRAEAGRLGAPVVVLLPGIRAVALAGSPQPVAALAALPAQPAAPPRDAATLLEERARALGFAPAGPAARVDLASPRPVPLALAKGRCYALAAALDGAARLAGALAPALEVAGGPALARRGAAPPFELAEQGLLEERALGAELGCALADGRAAASFQPAGAVGAGEAVVQLLERTPAEAEWTQLVHRHFELQRQRAADAAEARKACAVCADALQGWKGKPEESATWRACLKTYGLRPAECG